MSATKATGAEEVTWDLSGLYEGPDDPNITRDVDAGISDAKGFREKYHGKVASLGAAELRDAVAELQRLSEIPYRAGVFAYLCFSTDTADPKRGALVQKMQEKGAEIQSEVLFFELEWVAVDDEQAEKLLADPTLSEFRHHLEALRRYKPHLLSEAEEQILTQKRVSGSSAWSRLFTELTSALKVTLDGEELTLERALSNLQKPDRDLRRRTAEALTASLQEGLRTRAYIFNTLMLDKATEDRMRGYPSWISPRNLSNEASDESVQALIDACVSRYDIPQRYYRLKARLLGLDKIADYDRLAPVSTEEVFTDWDEAKAIVVDAYESFTPKAGSVIKRFFDEGWIDAAPMPNKTNGAYCMTHVPGLHPFVMMTFTGERRSILTLAHELGHGLHGFLAQDLGLFNAQTPLTLAETASVFGEALTFGRLLAAEDDPKKRLDLLTANIEDAIATVFRQIAMNRFEDAVHTARRSEGELPIDRLNELWISTQSDMLGEPVEISDGYKTWWSYIPHFIGSPGYVYAYSFGYLFSLAIYRKYQSEGDSMVDPYLELLAAGGSDSPERLAKIVGLDLTDPGFWKGGLEAIDAVLTEAEAAAEKI